MKYIFYKISLWIVELSPAKTRWLAVGGENASVYYPTATTNCYCMGRSPTPGAVYVQRKPEVTASNEEIRVGAARRRHRLTQSIPTNLYKTEF